MLLATGHVSTPPGAWWGRSLAPGPLTLGPGRPCWPFEPRSPFGPAGPCGETDRNEGHVRSLSHHGCLLVGPESGGGWPATPCREPHPKPPLWSWGPSAQDPEGSSALRAPSTTGLARGPRLVQDRERVHLRESPRTPAGPAGEGTGQRRGRGARRVSTGRGMGQRGGGGGGGGCGGVQGGTRTRAAVPTRTAHVPRVQARRPALSVRTPEKHGTQEGRKRRAYDKSPLLLREPQNRTETPARKTAFDRPPGIGLEVPRIRGEATCWEPAPHRRTFRRPWGPGPVPHLHTGPGAGAEQPALAGSGPGTSMGRPCKAWRERPCSVSIFCSRTSVSLWTHSPVFFSS